MMTNSAKSKWMRSLCCGAVATVFVVSAGCTTAKAAAAASTPTRADSCVIVDKAIAKLHAQRLAEAGDAGSTDAGADAGSSGTAASVALKCTPDLDACTEADLALLVTSRYTCIIDHASASADAYSADCPIPTTISDPCDAVFSGGKNLVFIGKDG